MKAAIIEALRAADHPLTLGELATLVAQHWRAVAYSLFQLVQSGTVDRLEGGTYALSVGVTGWLHSKSSAWRLSRAQMRPSATELFRVVAGCEARRRLQDRLDQIRGRGHA